MHVLIAGRTAAGKSTLARRLIASYRTRPSIVLDPLQDRWPTPYVYHEPRAFLRAVSSARECMIFVDESGEMIGRFNDEMFWLATRARHYGHISHFITQRATALAMTVRTQCSRAFVFRCAPSDARILADEFAAPELAACVALPIGGYLYVDPAGQVTRGDLFGKPQDFGDHTPDNPNGVLTNESASPTDGAGDTDRDRRGSVDPSARRIERWERNGSE